MSMSARPRPLLASIVGSAAWLGPWIVFLMIVSKRDNDNAVGYGLFLAAIPVALAVGTLVWRIIGALSRDGPPPLGSRRRATMYPEVRPRPAYFTAASAFCLAASNSSPGFHVGMASACAM